MNGYMANIRKSKTSFSFQYSLLKSLSKEISLIVCVCVLSLYFEEQF